MDEPAETNWERFGRASKAEAPEISELNQWRRSPMSFDVASYHCQVLIHRAHTVMLAEEGMIGRDEAAKILGGVREVEKMIRGRLAMIAAQEKRHRERVDKLRRAYDVLILAEKSLI
jgi:argininosuccinate lyase